MSRKNVTESFLLEELKELKLSLTTILTDQMNKSISILREHVIDKLIEENAKLQDRLNLMEDRVQKLETVLADSNQYSRKNNIELSGIPNNVSDEDLEDKCLELLNKIVVIPITSAEIDACHRLPTREGTKPVIIRFLGRKRRDEIISKRNKFNEIDLSDHGIRK